MTSPGLNVGGRGVARGWSVPRLVLIAGLLAGAASCGPRDRAPSGQASGPDAAVTVRSALVTTPATWQNLWGSWPLQRYDHPMVYDSDRKVMVIFSGRYNTNGPYYDDTWEWDGTRGTWNERTPAGTRPAERAGHAMVYDPVRKKTFLFSGWQPAAGFYIPEQWEWDGPLATWTQLDIAGAQPTARYGATMVWDPDRSRAVLFGGFDEATGRRNDIWEWDGTTKTWTDRTPAGTKPAPRWGHTAAYDPVRKKMVVYSGNTGPGAATAGSYVDETWEWDGAAQTWTKIATGTNVVYYYYGYTRLAYDVSRSKMVMYYDMNNVYEYDVAAPIWNKVTTTRVDTSSNPTYGAVTYDPDRKQIVVFGGNGRSLWELNGPDDTWTNRSVPVNGPLQRSQPALAYDNKRGRLMLFGGYSSLDGLYKQDTWQWSGTDATWTNLTNANAKPTGRSASAMVYDSLRDQLLMFGGYGVQTFDVWSWSPTTRNWTQVVPSGSQPNPTYNHDAFYDAARDKVIVFMNYYTIWEYDPATSKWTSRVSTPTGLPTGITQRGYYQVTFDTDRSKLLLVGGYGYVANVGNVYDADVWEWDAVTGTYTERAPASGAPAPVGRYDHGVSYDSARRVTVMFGGYGSVTGVASGPLNDSWEWDGIAGAWTETTPPGVKPLERYNHLQVFDPTHATTLVFGGTVNADSTYGPQEIWEYLANNSPRPNGSGCSAAAASTCASGNCVDGVCCAQTAATCNGTCKACNVPGKLGTCSDVPAGSPDDTCPTDQACDANHQCKAPLGHACGVYSDCASGHCADGVCCDTDCNGVCKVCNLNNNRGTCSAVSIGNEDPGTCASDPVQPRYCDASGVCTNGAKATGKPCTAGGQCTSTYCVDGFCCGSPCNQTCYSCGKPGAEGSCTAIAAGLPDHSATLACDGPAQYCTGAGSCGMNKAPNGGTCATAADCGSGFCVDGACCNSACTGVCQACNVTGNVGSCVNVLAGSQDALATTACAGVQYCDASGVCQSGLKVNGAGCTGDAECGSAHCVDGLCCEAACTASCFACNLPGSPGKCVGVAAGATDPSAATACNAPNFCTGDHVCTSGKKPNGATCGLDSECGSSHCVDKTCCETTCGGTCQTCANATGTCALVPAQMDPRMACKGEQNCGGTCDGQGGCLYAAQGKVCRQAGCQPDLGLITLGGACDGAGNCALPPPTKDCNGFGCFTDGTGAAVCKTDCSTDPDCAIRRYCQMAGDGGVTDGGAASTCPAAFDLGHTCTRNAQCVNNTCSDGVCCNVNCDKCGSCNTPGSVGTCIPIPAGTDPDGDCMDSASDPSHKCGGMCDGHAHCLYPAAGSTCGTCKACNGSGLCNVPPEDDEACGTIDCSALKTSCLNYHDISVKRCGALGACKMPNTTATCTDVTSLCIPDGGSSTDAGGITDAATDGGKPKSSGGGCGCDLGGAHPLSAFPATLLLLGLVTARRRRR